MKIVVCVKQVPDTETRVKIAATGDAISETDVASWIVSPYDEFAIEEALRIKEAKGGEVVLVTVGPERAQAALRTGLAMGADTALHVKDPLLDQADTLGTARALAAAVKTLAPFDLVLCGQQGVGGDNSQIPGLLAQLLDLPQVTVAVKIALQDGKAVVEREGDGVRETWEASLPAVISAQKGLNEPGLGLGPAELRPLVAITAIELPPARPSVKMIEGDPETQAGELLRLLHEEAKVI
jgi:electron transfer flavoprotein beta subunit